MPEHRNVLLFVPNDMHPQIRKHKFIVEENGLENCSVRVIVDGVSIII